jgi:hypothetical protein
VPALAVISDVTEPAKLSMEREGRLWLPSHAAVQLLVIGSVRPERSHWEPPAADWLEGFSGGRIEPAPRGMLADASSSGGAPVAVVVIGLATGIGRSSGDSPALASVVFAVWGLPVLEDGESTRTLSLTGVVVVDVSSGAGVGMSSVSSGAGFGVLTTGVSSGAGVGDTCWGVSSDAGGGVLDCCVSSDAAGWLGAG